MYLDIGKKYGYSVRLVVMLATLDESKHNNWYRHITTGRELVPDIAYHTIVKSYEIETRVKEYSNILFVKNNVDNHMTDDKYLRYYF